MNIDKIVAKISQFIEVKPEEFDTFMQFASVKQLKKNEIWEHEGDLGKLMGFVNNGILRQFYLKEGNEFTDQFYCEGDFVGNFVSYVKQKPSRSAIQALTDTELIVVSFDNVQKMYDLMPSMDRFGRLFAEQRLVEFSDRITSFLLDPPEERYRQLIEEKPNLLVDIPQYYIAQYLGIRPESLSRIRKRNKM